MQKILILKGLPASGKTTYAKGLLEGIYSDENGQFKWKRVNKDDLRAMIDGGKWSRENEKFVLSLRDAFINKAIMAGFSMIVDDTNFSNTHRNQMDMIAEIAKKHGFDVVVEEKNFDVPVEECIARDAKRQNPVGANVIYEMYVKYVKPLKDSQNQYQHDDQKVPALLVDIDGTATFNLGNRGFFEWDKVDLDTPNVELAAILRPISNLYDIVYVSGRDEVCREKTKQWLYKYNFPAPTTLFMRKKDDKRPDEIVKKEIYDNQIKDIYDIWGVFDDRPKVVRMWKGLGLRVYNCGDGVEF